MDQHQIDCFWSKVEIKDSIKDCWEWLGAKKSTGYGNVRINKKYLLAHRVSFELTHGEIPGKFIICHVCDNPGCCNPAHMMLGTVKSNCYDMIMKNRHQFTKNKAVGERNHNTKLTTADVIEIRRIYSLKILNQYQLASKYGVAQSSIGAIIRNKTWRHV